MIVILATVNDVPQKELGWNQTEFAERMGIHISHLSRVETGKAQPSLEVARRMAEVFEVTLYYLVDEEVDEFTPVTIRDESLAKRLQLLDQLEQPDRDALVHVIDAVLTKKKVTNLLKPER